MGQVYFEDVTEGMDIPTLEKNPTSRQLVQYAGASGDFYEIHYDKDYAIGNELPGPIIHGSSQERLARPGRNRLDRR